MGIMQIAGIDLELEYVRASAHWPFIPACEVKWRLPRMMLFAVGSRETNLTDEFGDFGLRNGRSGPLPGGAWASGVWQLDAGSHVIPNPFPVPQQADIAGGMLAGLFEHFGLWGAAIAAYNAGAGTIEYNLAHSLGVDTGTAGGNYSADVMARMTYLQQTHPAPVHPPAPLEDEMKNLLVGYQGSVFVVRNDLSGRVGIPDQADAKVLEATGQYVDAALSAQLMARIPVLG